MIQFKALVKKELKEAFRDKRALMAALLMAFLAPVMIFAVSKMAIKEAVSKPPVYLNITGAEYAPRLIKHLQLKNIFVIEQAPDEEKALWQQRDIQLIIPESFNQQMAEGKTIKVVLRADYSEKALNAVIRRIKKGINAFASQIGYKRLLVRGIDTSLIQPINLIEQSTASASSNAMFVTMLLGLYLLMSAFLSGLSVAIDTSAGERERNVLEVLLCQPVTTINIVLAKLACASVIAAIGVILTLALTTLAIGFVDLTQIGASFILNSNMVMALLLLLLPICVFASALQLFFAFGAKSFKEAQSTVTMIIMLPALIPMALTFINDKPVWLNWAPISGQSLLMEQLFKGDDINWSMVAFTSAVTIAITVVLVRVMAVKLKSEKVVLALN